MTENPTPEAAPAPLFEALRTDPAKVRDGVWVEHPETGDRFRGRRLWCAEHVRAFLQATRDYDGTNPKPNFATDEQRVAWEDARERAIEAVAMATGILTDWKIVANPDRPYDAAAMAAALRDPELEELLAWLRIAFHSREPFRPGADVSGN